MALEEDNITQLIKELGTPAVLTFVALLNQARVTFGAHISHKHVNGALRRKFIYDKNFEWKRGTKPKDRPRTPKPNPLEVAGYVKLLGDTADNRWSARVDGKYVQTIVYYRPEAITPQNAAEQIIRSR